MENQNHENINDSVKEQKLTATIFFQELDALLKKAPDDAVTFVTAITNPEDEKEGPVLFNAQGKIKHIIYSLYLLCKEDPRAKEILFKTTAILKCKCSMEERDPLEFLSNLSGLSGLVEALKK